MTVIRHDTTPDDKLLLAFCRPQSLAKFGRAVMAYITIVSVFRSRVARSRFFEDMIRLTYFNFFLFFMVLHFGEQWGDLHLRGKVHRRKGVFLPCSVSGGGGVGLELISFETRSWPGCAPRRDDVEGGKDSPKWFMHILLRQVLFLTCKGSLFFLGTAEWERGVVSRAVTASGNRELGRWGRSMEGARRVSGGPASRFEKNVRCCTNVVCS